MELAEAPTQRCRICEEIRPIDAFDIRADTGTRKTHCKACRRAYQNARNRRLNPPKLQPPRVAGTTELLVCTRCREPKPAAAFPRRTREREELQAWCRACFARVHSAHYAANREREISRVRRNTARSRKAARELVAEYLATHPCVDCGEPDLVVLEFDHVGPKRKDVSLMVAAGYPLATIVAEIANCQVRCGNCHRRKTHDRRMAERLVRAVKGP